MQTFLTVCRRSRDRYISAAGTSNDQSYCHLSMATFEGKLVGIKRKRPQTMSKLETGSNTLLGQAIETSDTDTLEYILSNTEDIPEAVSTIPVEYIPKFIEFLSNQFASYQDMSPVCLSWLTVIFQKHLKHLKENPHVSELLQEVRMRLKHRTSMMSSLRGLKVKVDLALST